jgi:hypothetical protein
MSRRRFTAACAAFLTAATIGCSNPPAVYECRVTAEGSAGGVEMPQIGDLYATTGGCRDGDEHVGTRRYD